MGRDSLISWTHHTFNPWHGCAKVSEGCKFCYAEVQDKRFSGDQAHWGIGAPRKMLSDQYWRQLTKWNNLAASAGEYHRVFTASMADVFEDRPDLVDPRARLNEMITAHAHLAFLILTKRPENVVRLMQDLWLPMTGNKPDSFRLVRIPHNAWIGCTAENQQRLEERAMYMADQVCTILQPTITFLSAEPLLGPLDLTKIPWKPDWVIVGGESGHHARKMEMSWARDLHDQCEALGIKFFFKQTGSVVAKARGYQHPSGADQREWDTFASLTYMSQSFPEYSKPKNFYRLP